MVQFVRTSIGTNYKTTTTFVNLNYGRIIMDKKKITLLISLLLTIFIFSMSLFSGADSGEMSSGLSMTLKNIWDSIFKNNPISLSFLQTFVRKAAHVFEYLLLGVSYFFTAKAWKLSILKILTIGFITAGIDEWIQTFVPGRAGRWLDILVFDLGGFIIGLALMILIFDRRSKIHPDDVLKDLEDQKISSKKAYKYLYKQGQRLSFTNHAHFLKLNITLIDEPGVNKFLKVLFFIPLPLFIARFALLFIRDFQYDGFSKEDIKRVINTKGIKINVYPQSGEQIEIITF